MGKVRRKFDAAFKVKLVQEILAGETTQSKACRDHQLSPTVVKRWVEKFQTGQPIEDRPSARERQLEEENRRLKAKIGDLVMQIDVLKKLDGFVRQRRNATSSVVTASNLARLRKDVQ
jgi:transposase-like protein